jgi:hypothetical protein
LGLAAVSATFAAVAWPAALAPGSKFPILVAYGLGLVAVIALYLGFATIWHWWPVKGSRVRAPDSPGVQPGTQAGAGDVANGPALADPPDQSAQDIPGARPGSPEPAAAPEDPVGDGAADDPEPGPATQPVRLAPRPAFLAGRETLLADLHARLTGNGAPWPRISVLHGLGGAGKTSLAVEYAHRHLAGLGVAWQFAAENPAVLTAEFAILQAQLGIHDAPNAVASVHAVLATYPAEWLLIFDNAPDLAAIEAFLPPAGRGRVLITSQSGLWPSGQGIEVGVLSTADAADFLIKCTGDPDHQSADTLARELDGLPLALEQAAAYIRATADNLAGYLALLRLRRSDMLARGEPTGYRKTVATTWALAFDRLLQTSPEGVGLLRLIAFYAPEAIPLRLLLRPIAGLGGQLGQQVSRPLMRLLDDALVARDAIAALRRYSLVTPAGEASAGEGSVSVHRLVQAVTVDQMSESLASGWRRAAAATVEAALPANPKLPSTWPAFATLLPHAQAALAPQAAGLARVADYLGRSGSYLAARDLYQKLADAQRQRLGAEDPGTFSSLNGLARWTGQTGDKALARDMLAELLPIEERVLGPEHPLTLETRSSIARWTGEAGDPAAARDLFGALLRVEERVLGPEDPETIDTRAAFARWTGEAGNAAEARDLFVRALPIEERVLGHDHPQTLDTRCCIARWTGNAGDPTGARNQFALVIPDIERALGPEHPRTLAYQDHLAYWTWQAGDAAKARDMFAKLLPIVERVLGPEHRQTQGTRVNLARSARDANRSPRSRG